MKTAKVLTESDVTAIRDVMRALIAHRKVLEYLPQDDDTDDLIEGMNISYTKLFNVLKNEGKVK